VNIKKIKISTDFSDAVGHRTKEDGPKSGEEFREKFLEPLISDQSVDIVEIDMDDTWGYPSSFLEESFGGLVRKFGRKLILKKIEIISTQDESLKARITEYIDKAEKG